MDQINWSQFITLFLIFGGAYLILEVVRRATLGGIKGATDDHGQHTKAQGIFRILRIIVFAAFLIAIIFTATFNRHQVNQPREDLGHQLNMKQNKEIDEAALKAKIKAKEEKYKEKSLEETNKASEESYDQFIKEKQSNQ